MAEERKDPVERKKSGNEAGWPPLKGKWNGNDIYPGASLEEIAARIRMIRSVKGLQQTTLAKLVHCSQASLSGYEKGARMIPMTILKRIAEVGGCSERWLLLGESSGDAPDFLQKKNGENKAEYSEMLKKNAAMGKILSRLEDLSGDDLNKLVSIMNILFGPPKGEKEN